MALRCEVVAVGTELLLGQIVDTNSSWIGEQLAAVGHRLAFPGQGGRQPRPASWRALRQALERADAVIVCGGLGPTHDDITRDAIAEVMGVELQPRRGGGRAHPPAVRVAAAGAWPTTTCARPRCPTAPRSSRRRGAPRPGSICPVGDKVLYARARRAARDAGDARAGGAARPAPALGRGRRSSPAARCARGARARAGLNERLDGAHRPRSTRPATRRWRSWPAGGRA